MNRAVFPAFVSIPFDTRYGPGHDFLPKLAFSGASLSSRTLSGGLSEWSGCGFPEDVDHLVTGAGGEGRKFTDLACA